MAAIYLTKEGLENIQNELNELVKKSIPAIKKRMVNAKEDGDLSENNAWITAKEDMENARTRVAEIKRILKHAQIIDKPSEGKTISIGDTVKISIDSKDMTVKIVSTLEADPTKSMISEESPLGKVLINQKIGSTVSFVTPAGEQQVKIVERI
jgi:transcription elongation factor GreA